MGISKNLKCGLLITAGIFLPLLLWLHTSTVFGGDGGDLVTAAFVHGVAHPPGYPLYTLLAFLLTKVTFLGSVAGRVTYLSTIPAFISILILYAILYFHTHRILPSLIGTFLFGFCYVVLLLAIIPEVFAMHLLLVLGIILCLTLWKKTKSINYLYAGFLIFGLGLSHHHTIFFLAPAFAYYIFSNRSLLPRKSKKYFLLSTSCFLLGLLPYLYVYFAARTNPVINWENPQTLHNFIRLVTRAVYGTFQSGITVGWGFGERMVHLKLFYQSIVIDFTRAGVILGLAGLVYLFIKARKDCYFFFLAFFFSGPLFVYYASFPLGNNFSLGTVERFYVIPYLFIVIFMVNGILGLHEIVNRLITGITKKKRAYPIIILFTVYPVLLGITTIPKLIPLRTDQTAEHIAYDVLHTAGKDSMLLLIEDTRLFDTEYVYYTSGRRYPTTLIHFGLLGFPFYRDYVAKHYSEIYLSDAKRSKNDVQEFLDQNARNFTLYIDYPYDAGDAYHWIPMGILYRLYPKDASFSAQEYLDENNRLFDSYQDPLKGALGSYKHVMLADSLRVYSNGRFEVGKALVKLGLIKESQVYFREAVRLNPDNSGPVIELIGTDILLKQCSEAESNLQTALSHFPSHPQLLQMGISLYTHCLSDPAKASEYEKRYNESLHSNQPSLKQL